MIPILFHPDAEAELDYSISFYEDRQPGLGLDFKQEVFEGIVKIHDAPEQWPKYNFGVRKYLLPRFPFYIYYLGLPDLIWIVAIAHCSRKPNYWKNRITNGSISG